MNYYITHERDTVNNAGSKAPADINCLCKEMNWRDYEIPTVSRQASKASRYINILTCVKKWTKLKKIIKKNEFVLYQHPMYSGTQIARPYLLRLRKKGVTTIALIHDLEHLRSENRDAGFESREIQFIDSFEKVIAHNQRMKKYLISKGIKEDKIICLKIFDYLTTYAIEEDKHHGNNSVAIAGNLDRNKCSYIYEFAKQNTDLSVILYGGNYQEQIELKNICYKGSFKPDELPLVVDAKYGLVWDGDALEECSGTMGNYLKYNNPHKLSLYITAGIPVIVWRKSAVSDFVIENECGIVVDSLFNLKCVLDDVSSDKYNQMRINCIELSRKMRQGLFFKNALRCCEDKKGNCERLEEC